MNYNFNIFIKDDKFKTSNEKIKFAKLKDNSKEEKEEVAYLIKKMKEEILLKNKEIRKELPYLLIDAEFERLRENEKQNHIIDNIDIILSC